MPKYDYSWKILINKYKAKIRLLSGQLTLPRRIFTLHATCSGARTWSGGSLCSLAAPLLFLRRQSIFACSAGLSPVSVFSLILPAPRQKQKANPAANASRRKRTKPETDMDREICQSGRRDEYRKRNIITSGERWRDLWRRCARGVAHTRSFAPLGKFINLCMQHSRGAGGEASFHQVLN